MRDAALGLVLSAVLAPVAGLGLVAGSVLAAVLEQDTRRLVQGARAAQDTKPRMRIRRPCRTRRWTLSAGLLDAVLALDVVPVLDAVLVLDSLLVRGLVAAPVQDAVIDLVLFVVLWLDTVLVLDAALVLDAKRVLVLDTLLVASCTPSSCWTPCSSPGCPRCSCGTPGSGRTP